MDFFHVCQRGEGASLPEHLSLVSSVGFGLCDLVFQAPIFAWTTQGESLEADSSWQNSDQPENLCVLTLQANKKLLLYSQINNYLIK